MDDDNYDDDLLDDDVEELEDTEDDKFDGPDDGDLSDEGDDSFMEDDDEGDDEDDEVAKAGARPRRRAPVRPGTIGGVARSRLDKPAYAEKAWQELSLQVVDGEEPVPYNIRDNYEKGSRVEHSKFGIGHVVEIVSPKKIEVLFQDGLRKLVQNR